MTPIKYPAVFLDRDGTIIEEVHYLNSLDNIQFFKGCYKSLRKLITAGYKLIVVTNQSGIARGKFSEKFVKETHSHISRLLVKHGVHLSGIYYCPHHPDGKVARFARECTCRKPNTGMLIKAEKEHKLDLSKSFMIGDHIKDILFGNREGLKTILVKTGHGLTELKNQESWRVNPDFIAEDIVDAVAWITA